MARPARPSARHVRGRRAPAGAVRGDPTSRRRLGPQSLHADRGARAARHRRGGGVRYASTRAPDVSPAEARGSKDGGAAGGDGVRGHDVLPAGDDARIAPGPARVKRRVLGRTGLAVSRVGFGAWAIGGNRFGNSYGATDDAESARAVRHAYELGCNFFDTADAYGHGHSEEVLGAALAGLRQRVIVATKVGANFYNRDVNPLLRPGIVAALGRPATELAPDVTPRATHDATLSPGYVRHAVEQSLRRL